MKRYWILLMVLLVSCEADFDELKDTNQRCVTFVLNTNGFFSDILSPVGDGFALNSDTILDEKHCLRFVTYCYNQQGNLIQKNTSFSRPNDFLSTTIKHLHKDSIYHFVFFADVVEYYGSNNYFERWFQLDVDKKIHFYLTSLEHDSIAKYNILKMDTITLMPSNQTITMPFFPLTASGYCVFKNGSNIDKVSGYVSRYVSFRATSLQGITNGRNTYSFYPSRQEEYTIPITTTQADKRHLIRIITQTLSNIDTAQCSFYNSSHRPFVITIDCHTKKIINCQYY